MAQWNDEIWSDGREAMLTERRLAERWAVSQRTLQRWRLEGYGPVWIRIGGSIRYALSEVQAYEKAARAGGSK